MYEVKILKACEGAAVCRIALAGTFGERLIDLRHRLLREGLPRASAHFAGDDDPLTWHVGVLCGGQANPEDLLVCCASFMSNPYEGRAGWQLRGMCTAREHQGKGYGTLLLKTAEEVISADSGVRLFWCNARVPAVPFYEKQGWKIVSEEFEIPTAGPHRRMLKRLGAF